MRRYQKRSVYGEKDKWTYIHIPNMPGLRLQIKKEVEMKFREAAMRRFGFTKGALSLAAEEAIEKWLLSLEEVKFEGEPVEAIDGLLSSLNMDSVELQHLARRLWAEKHVSR